MKSFNLKLNDEGTAFVCDSQEETLKAIDYFKKKKPKTTMKMENEVSDIFRGYYFQGIIGFIHELGVYPTLARYDLNYRNDGFTMTDAYHELLKRDFNGITIKMGDRIEKIGKSVAVKDSGKFTSYVERISRYTSENFGVPVPTPDEFSRYSSKKKDFSRFYIDNQDLFGIQLKN